MTEEFFIILHKDSSTKARVGILKTAHGEIETPIFMPVGTQGTVKAVHMRELEHDIDAKIILANTYHLYLRPGLSILEQAGGIHLFNSWKKPILSDSGGYQVYSLGERRKITEDGAIFQSHIDGKKIFFTPENVIDIQRSIGADIIMAFDECTPYPCDYSYAKKSMELTHRWLQRSMKRFNATSPKYNYPQILFPIIQGSIYKDLRIESTKFITDLDFRGIAIGGLSVGEPTENMYDITNIVTDYLPENKPRYLMGVGTPANILECIALGIDMFDCVMPTRNARNGMIFTTEGIINIKNQKWKHDFSPIDRNLDGYVSQNYSKSFLRHLIIAKEILGAQIASIQNLCFYLWLVKQARKHIFEGTFTEWKKNIVPIISQKL